MAGRSTKYGFAVLDRVVPEDEILFVFRGQDRHVLTALDAYIRALEEDDDVTEDFVHEVSVERERIRTFQENNPDRIKAPD